MINKTLLDSVLGVFLIDININLQNNLFDTDKKQRIIKLAICLLYS